LSDSTLRLQRERHGTLPPEAEAVALIAQVAYEQQNARINGSNAARLALETPHPRHAAVMKINSADTNRLDSVGLQTGPWSLSWIAPLHGDGGAPAGGQAKNVRSFRCFPRLLHWLWAIPPYGPAC